MRNPWSKFNPQQSPSGPARNEGGELIPDRVSAEPIVGFRSWTVVHDEHGLALKSLNKLWVWDNPSTAECVTPAIWSQQILRHDGVSPDPGCACGLYAQLPDHPLSEWAAMRKAQVSATGTVSLYGRVVVCERGYKGQYAALQEPIILEAECMAQCEKPPSRVHIPSRHLYRYFVSCDEHFRAMDTSEEVTVQVGPWLKLAAEELSERYDVEFLSWSML